MAGITKANAYAAAAKILCDPTYQTFTGGYTAGTTTYLEAIVDRVAHEISVKNPLTKRCNLALIDNTWDISLGSLSFMRIKKVFYPTDTDTIRQWDEYDTTLTLKIHSSPPHSDGIISGTLTGTVTFTKDSRAVTGSGTSFLSQLQEGYLICEGKVADAAYKWYRIAHITSDTSLTLSEPFEETTVTDTINLTKYRDPWACARIEYETEYTVSTSSNMPSRFDDLLILGIVAHAATEFASGQGKTKLTDIETDHDAALVVINSLNVGGDVASKYSQIMQSQIAMAQMISSYKQWANMKWLEYQQGLKNITKFKVHEWGSMAI